MCSICGGYNFDDVALKVFKASEDRGRDYSNIFYRKGSWICNHRAVPTTEIENSEFNQPFGCDYKIVHNGTIANDKELGNPDGMIDSYILSKVLDCSSIHTLKDSLTKVKGSYAIAILKPNGHFYLACNYKPIFYAGLGTDGFIFSSYRHHLKGISGVEKLTPYSILDTETGESLEIEREEYNRVAVICSGGLDSTAVAAYACKTYGPENVTLIHYAYGCIAEGKEVDCIRKITDYLGCTLSIIPIDMSFMEGHSTLLQGDTSKVTKGIAGSEYAYEWVPARNLIMLSLAVGFCEANGYDIIMLGTNLEEGGAYPDNENQFIKDFDACLYGAVQNGKKVRVETPVGNLMKHEIVAFGNKYGAPFHLTWSCYKDGDKACGVCGPCRMRSVAFLRNGLKDPLEYEHEVTMEEAGLCLESPNIAPTKAPKKAIVKRTKNKDGITIIHSTRSHKD